MSTPPTAAPGAADATESREILAEDLTPGTELRFGDYIVEVIDAHNDPEGVWVELSTGDQGYTDYGVTYELAER